MNIRTGRKKCKCSFGTLRDRNVTEVLRVLFCGMEWAFCSFLTSQISKVSDIQNRGLVRRIFPKTIKQIVLEEIREKTICEDPDIILVGNKSDMEDKRQVPRSAAISLAEAHK